MDHWILSYKSPAEAWNEALPLGNGTLVVMSYGRLENETLEDGRLIRTRKQHSSCRKFSQEPRQPGNRYIL